MRERSILTRASTRTGLSMFHAFPRIALKRGDRAMVTRR